MPLEKGGGGTSKFTRLAIATVREPRKGVGLVHSSLRLCVPSPPHSTRRFADFQWGDPFSCCHLLPFISRSRTTSDTISVLMAVRFRPELSSAALEPQNGPAPACLHRHRDFQWHFHLDFQTPKPVVHPSLLFWKSPHRLSCSGENLGVFLIPGISFFPQTARSKPCLHASLLLLP